MKKTNENRREFLRSSMLLALSLPVVGLLQYPLLKNVWASKGEDPIPAGSNPVPETDAVASAIGYKGSIKEVDFTRYPQRKAKEAKDQFCRTCALYVPSNKTWGKCQMLTSGLVKAEGWCGSWSKKS